MTHIEVVDPQTASGAAADFYKEAGVSLIMQCFSPRPDFGHLVNEMGNLMHFRKGTLSRRDHEAIATFVSALNHCPF
ncbi:MAG: hypothetical protein U0694_19730 [Anaerolineae bacterium]